ncbi:MAG: transporter [Butyrivibrio sp.]|nr:transporter [Butyrivibrio sp.]
MKKKVHFFDIILLQMVVVIYSINTVIAKFVSEQSFLSFKFIVLYLLEFLVLGIYAVFWQQMIKRFELSIAYANKAMTLLWSLLWSVLIFGDSVTPAKVGGVLLVIAGTIILNSEAIDETPSEDQTV